MDTCILLACFLYIYFLVTERMESFVFFFPIPSHLKSRSFTFVGTNSSPRFSSPLVTSPRSFNEVWPSLFIFCTKVFCSAAKVSLITGEFHPKADCISAEVEMIPVCQVVKSVKSYVIFQNESQYIKAIQFSFFFLWTSLYFVLDSSEIPKMTAFSPHSFMSIKYANTKISRKKIRDNVHFLFVLGKFIRAAVWKTVWKGARVDIGNSQ